MFCGLHVHLSYSFDYSVQGCTHGCVCGHLPGPLGQSTDTVSLQPAKHSRYCSRYCCQTGCAACVCLVSKPGLHFKACMPRGAMLTFMFVWAGLPDQIQLDGVSGRLSGRLRSGCVSIDCAAMLHKSCNFFCKSNISRFSQRALKCLKYGVCALSSRDVRV